MSISEPTCLHDWRAANWIMIVAIATVSTVGANHDIRRGFMRLMIKQRVFAWTDTYDIYDEWGNKKYFVKSEAFRLTHQVHVYDIAGNEIGLISQRLFTFLPTFDISVGGRPCGSIRKEFTFFKPSYSIEYGGWQCDGDFLSWNYSVTAGSRLVANIAKQLLSWGDTYTLDISDPGDEIMVLMLVIAIDAANCSQNNN